MNNAPSYYYDDVYPQYILLLSFFLYLFFFLVRSFDFIVRCAGERRGYTHAMRVHWWCECAVVYFLIRLFNVFKRRPFARPYKFVAFSYFFFFFLNWQFLGYSIQQTFVQYWLDSHSKNASFFPSLFLSSPLLSDSFPTGKKRKKEKYIEEEEEEEEEESSILASFYFGKSGEKKKKREERGEEHLSQ